MVNETNIQDFPNKNNTNPQPQAPSADQQLQALLKMREMYLVMQQNVTMFADDEVFKDLEIIAVPTEMMNPTTNEPIMKTYKPGDALVYIKEKIEDNAKAIRVAKSGIIIAK
jgi:hypothetical protein